MSIALSVFHHYVEEAFKKLEALNSKIDVDIAEDRAVMMIKNEPLVVFYRHDVMRQIWVTSYLTGAHHFMYDVQASGWLHTRSGQEMFDFIEAEMNQAERKCL